MYRRGCFSRLTACCIAADEWALVLDEDAFFNEIDMSLPAYLRHVDQLPGERPSAGEATRPSNGVSSLVGASA